MLKRFAGLFALVLLAACIALVPQLLYGDTGTPPSLSITAGGPPAASPNPVAVGDATNGPTATVLFAVNINSGNEQNESGSVSVKNQQYTISGGGGMITGVGVPEGYSTSPSPIPSTGASTVTVTGNGETSFTISVTLFFPQSVAGVDTVTCSGTLTLSDNSTINSSPSGSVQVTAVAVDSIALADSPQDVSIGQTLTRTDFTITTTPAGYGKYQDPESQDYLVSFSPSSFQVAVGDNNVTATCGVSQASLTLVGFSLTGSWGSVEEGDGNDGQAEVSYSLTLTGDAETQGAVNITGPLSAVSGDTNPTIYSGQQFDGNVWLQDPGSLSGSSDETINVNVSEGGSTGSVNVANSEISNQEAEAAKALLGKVAQKVANQKVNAGNVQVLPAGVGNGLNLTLVAVAGVYSANTCTARVVATGAGSGITFLGLDWWTDNPSATVQVGAPNPTQVVVNNNPANVEFFSNEAKQQGVQTEPALPMVPKDVIPDWTTAPMSTVDAGPADAQVTASSQAPGDHWNLISSAYGAQLYQPAPTGGAKDPNWQPIANTTSEFLSVNFSWF